jgi:hypothetical protein
MNFGVVEKIANAVLYEGYLLYPYRQSAIKNQQRFNFGVLYPQAHCELQSGADAWEMQTECLVSGDSSARVEVKIRFLQMITRQERQEGVEREVHLPSCTMGAALVQPFTFDGLEGELKFSATQIEERLFRITLAIRNCAAMPNATNREDVLALSFVSVHSLLHVSGGEFISLLDPPDEFKAAVAGCKNIGTWPVLAGDEPQRDIMLSAPIILYDYPQIAPESAGDLFDGTEIDEILALRILTMTDSEKLEVRNGDDRARKILERTEMLPPEHFQKLHGALRSLSPQSGGS